MEKKSGSGFLGMVLCLSVLVIVAGGADGADESLAVKCSAQFQKVTQCLPFVTAAAAAPSKDCCDSVTDLKKSEPACLCFIIQQIHNGSNAAIKSMGVQEARLLQLPSACRLANASITECPRLLHLPPNSPDAAIFTNVSSAVSTTPVATPGTSSPTTPNNGFWHKPRLAGCSATIAVVIAFFFFHAFPMS